MKKVLIGIAAGAALTLSANAALADGYGYGSIKDGAVARQANWNGLYIGAAVGYGIATTEVDIGVSAPEVGRFPIAHLDGLSSDGFLGTITVGYDRQVHPNLVLGVFADYSIGELETHASLGLPLPPHNIEAVLKDSWAVGAKVGFVDSCCTMWYMTAGYAQADVEIDVLGVIVAGSLSESMDGWFIGGGVEHQLSNNLFLKLDYRYTDYDKVTWAPAGAEEYLDTETDVHSIRLGVNWKVDLFGGHHTAPAYDSLK